MGLGAVTWPRLGGAYLPSGAQMMSSGLVPPGLSYVVQTTKLVLSRPGKNSSLTSQMSQGSLPACPPRSRMVWEFPDLRILFGEPRSPALTV